MLTLSQKKVLLHYGMLDRYLGLKKSCFIDECEGIIMMVNAIIKTNPVNWD